MNLYNFTTSSGANRNKLAIKAHRPGLALSLVRQWGALAFSSKKESIWIGFVSEAIILTNGGSVSSLWYDLFRLMIEYIEVDLTVLCWALPPTLIEKFLDILVTHHERPTEHEIQRAIHESLSLAFWAFFIDHESKDVELACLRKNFSRFDVYAHFREFLHPDMWMPTMFLIYLRSPRASIRRDLLHFSIELGADPCRLSEEGMTPTGVALLVNCEKPWFEVLSKAGINISAVARHTFKRCAQRDNQAKQQQMLDRFAAVSIYPDATWFDGGEDPVYSVKTSGINFSPPTRHDPTKETGEMRRRAARTIIEE